MIYCVHGFGRENLYEVFDSVKGFEPVCFMFYFVQDFEPVCFMLFLYRTLNQFVSCCSLYKTLNQCVSCFILYRNLNRFVFCLVLFCTGLWTSLFHGLFCTGIWTSLFLCFILYRACNQCVLRFVLCRTLNQFVSYFVLCRTLSWGSRVTLQRTGGDIQPQLMPARVRLCGALYGNWMTCWHRPWMSRWSPADTWTGTYHPHPLPLALPSWRSTHASPQISAKVLYEHKKVDKVLASLQPAGVMTCALGRACLKSSSCTDHLSESLTMATRRYDKNKIWIYPGLIFLGVSEWNRDALVSEIKWYK